MAPLKKGLSLRESAITNFQCVQLIDSISEKLKFIIKKDNQIAANLITYDHHLIKGPGVITLNKLPSRQKDVVATS